MPIDFQTTLRQSQPTISFYDNLMASSSILTASLPLSADAPALDCRDHFSITPEFGDSVFRFAGPRRFVTSATHCATFTMRLSSVRPPRRSASSATTPRLAMVLPSSAWHDSDAIATPIRLADVAPCHSESGIKMRTSFGSDSAARDYRTRRRFERWCEAICATTIEEYYCR